MALIFCNLEAPFSTVGRYLCHSHRLSFLIGYQSSREEGGSYIICAGLRAGARRRVEIWTRESGVPQMNAKSNDCPSLTMVDNE